MSFPLLTRQSGYALIFMVLGLMGVGGIVLVGFTQGVKQEVDQQKFLHNKRVLEEAKQALLMYAYSYPANNPGRGPGRMPCPDTDNDGIPNPSIDCTNGAPLVGRFPWNDPDMNLYDIRDASGERLWYAVSRNFANQPNADIINSDTTGTITVYDQGGTMIYDNSVAGVAAVIIAPGAVIDRAGVAQDRSIGNLDDRNDTVADTDPGIINPGNYLDLSGANDNTDFINAPSANGFILGPVFDTLRSDIVVNDQMIIITAEEVIAMAEKSVLETYRDSIENYRQTLWAIPGNRRYPWLAAYNDTTDLDIYNARSGVTSGRVPFMDYFVDENSPHSVIVSDLQIAFDLDVSYNSMVDNSDPFDPTYIAAASDVVSNYPDGDQTINISNARVSFSQIPFNGVPDTDADSIGTFIVRDSGNSAITATTYPTNTERRYFWDGCPTCFEPADGWEFCPVNVGDGTDCALNPAGTAFVPYTDWSNHADVRIRMIEFQYIDPEFVIELDYLPLPAVTAPTLPTAVSHSRRQYTFRDSEVTVLPIVDPAEPDTRNFFDIRVSMCDQDNFVGNGLNLVSLGNPDGDTVACSTDLVVDVTTSYQDDLVVTVDWFPPLPRWISDNQWDDAVMLSYMPDFAPGGDGNCTPDADPVTPLADDCLVVSNLGGFNNNIAALLVIAGENDFIDGDDLNSDGDWDEADEDPPDFNFFNDLQDIFEPENYSGLWPHPVPNNDPNAGTDTSQPRVFDKREDTVPGNRPDTIFIIN